MTKTSIRFTSCRVLIAALAGVGLAQQAFPQEAPAPAPATAAPTGSTVIASTDGETPGMRVEVTEFKRSGGGVVTLKFALINDSDEAFGFGYDMGDVASTIDRVYLVDNAGKKKYQVIRDAGNQCLCSSDLDDVEPQSRVSLWARFPAPPADVEKLSIMIPHFIPLDDVPLSQ